MSDLSKIPEPAMWTDPKGRLVPASLVKDSDKLIDAQVREIFAHGLRLMAEIARFRGHCFDDIGSLRELLAEDYGLKRGGAKGNTSFTSYDGTIKVEVRIADQIAYGPELQVAKGLMDEYIEEVSEGVPDAVRALLEHAFEVGSTGHVNRSALYGLRRLNVQHPKWDMAMKAIADSMRVMGAKETFVISVRRSPEENFAALPINLANACEPEADEASLERGEVA
ncbi:MAG: DUF3164 family protein [Jannaschia sp.]